MINRLIKRYIGLSAPLKTSFWFVFCNVIQKGMLFFTTPIFTRILTQEEYGIVSVYNSWLGIVTIIATLQLAQGGFNKAMIIFEEDRDGYTSSVFTLSIGTVVISYFLFLVLRIPFGQIIDLPAEFIVLLFIEILFSNAMAMLTSRERFEFRYRFIVIVTLIANVLATLLSLILVIVTDQNHAFMRVFGTTLIHVLIYTIAIYNIYKKKKVFYNKKYWNYALKFNLPLIPHYLSQQILNSSDRIMINSIIGSTDAAKYSLSYQIAVAMGVLTNAIHATFAPWTYQKINLKKYADIGKRAFQLEIIIGGILCLFSFFAPEFIRVLGPESYYDAMYVIPPVSMSVFFLFLYSFFGNIEFYFEKTNFVMIASCVVAVSNIGLNAIFLPIYGYAAAGYTTLFCYIIYSIMHFLFMIKVCKENNIKNPYPAKLMWFVALICTLLSLGISFLYHFILVRYFLILAVFIVLVIYFIKNKKSIIGKL